MSTLLQYEARTRQVDRILGDLVGTLKRLKCKETRVLYKTAIDEFLDVRNKGGDCLGSTFRVAVELTTAKYRLKGIPVR